MLPKDFPYRFFNPLTSKHREDYIHVLFSIEAVLDESAQIALPRTALAAELRRTFRRENYALDVSDEEDYDEEPSDDPVQDHLAYTIRLFLRSGWIDADESGDHATDSLFFTQYGKMLTVFLRELTKAEDQSGYVINTYSNLQQVRMMPESGLICIQNAHKSTRQLLNTLTMLFAKLKNYYTAVLENTNPEDLLKDHLYGYIQDIVEKVIFPIKVDDSVDRFKGRILTAVQDIRSDTYLLNRVIAGALQTKRVSSHEDGMDNILTMLHDIQHGFENIGDYMQQLDDKNQTYIRITRQKLTYMLSSDTSIKGDIIALLQDAEDRIEHLDLSPCFHLFDLRQVTDGSLYHPRKRISRKRAEELPVEEPPLLPANADLLDMRAAEYTVAKTNAYAQGLLDGEGCVAAQELTIQNDEEYLRAVFLALNSASERCLYRFETNEGTVAHGIYGIPDFRLMKKGDK